MVAFSIEAVKPHSLSKTHENPFPTPRASLYSQVPLARTAMAINGSRNKPFGPGGSTRRLHHSPAARAQGHSCGASSRNLQPDGCRAAAGAKQDRRGCKGYPFARHGSAVIGPKHSCQRQQCSGCCRRVSGAGSQTKALALSRVRRGSEAPGNRSLHFFSSRPAGCSRRNATSGNHD